MESLPSQLRLLLAMFLASILACHGGTVSAVFISASDVPVSANSYDATGNTVDLSLNFAPQTGTSLVVIRNSGRQFIQGRFDNLAHGQQVNLSFAGVRYPFVANYHGGSGNDLILQWANTRLLGWGGNSTVSPQRTMTEISSHPAFSGRSIIDVAAGMSHQLVLCADGTILAWGDNTYGQLGNGSSFVTGVTEVVKTGVLSDKTVVAISAGQYHSVALCSDGTVASWGNNGNGQLGDNSRVNRDVPVLVDRTGTLAGKEVVSVHAGQAHTLAVCSDGVLAAWGSNQYRQLGNASYQISTVPIPVNLTGALAGKTIAQVDVGSNHSLALCSDNTLAAWGHNSNGQLGTGNTLSNNVPVSVLQTGVLLSKTVTSISCGNLHSMVVCSDGTLASWGRNGTGQLGNGSTGDRTSPVLVNRSGVMNGRIAQSLDAGFGHSLVTCTDGSLAAWGYNFFWQLGVNTTGTTSTTPVLGSTVALRAGERFISCTTGDTANTSFALVASLPPPSSTTLAATSIRDTRAVLNGSVNAAGADTTVTIEYGLSNTYGSVISPSPESLSGVETTSVNGMVTDLLPAKTYHYRVVASNSNGVTRGEDMTFETSSLCTLAAVSLSHGNPGPAFSPDRFRYAVTVAHDVSSITLTPVSTDSNARITLGESPLVSGQASLPQNLNVGDNPLVVSVRSADLAEIITYQFVVTRLPANLVFRSTGSTPVSSAGFSLGGSLMPLSLEFAPVPGTPLTLLNNTGQDFIHGEFSDLPHGQTTLLTHGRISYAYVANYHGGTGNDLVLEWAGNRLLAWGSNASGQLGNNSLANRLIPTPVHAAGVLAGKTIIHFAAGEYHSLALCSDGTLAAWGQNDFGQLGNQTTVSSSVPVAVNRNGVLAGRRVVSIEASGYGCIALCADGGVVAWGYGGNGQLGTDGLLMSATPVNVLIPGAPPAANVVEISSGGGHHAAKTHDGRIFSWGENQYGQLGNASKISSAIPSPVERGGVLSGKQVIAIKTGSYSSYALCTDGSWASWGYNWEGQLGNDLFIPSSVPVLMNLSSGLSGKSLSKVFTGSYHCLALCSDGSLAGWGQNYNGQLGSGPYSIAVPTLFSVGGSLTGKKVDSMSPGGGFNLVVCSDGSMSSWGYNGNGQLGDNSMTDRLSPVSVSSSAMVNGERFVAADAASFHSLALVASPPPVAASLSASQIMAGSVSLGGLADAKGNSTTIKFEYGLDSSYGSFLPASLTSPSGNGPASVQANLAGLLPGTTYHCRLVATNRAGIARSEGITFTTNHPPQFTGYAVSCGFGKSVSVSTRKILARASDADGDVVSVSHGGTTSLHGGVVALISSNVVYTPRSGFSGSDSFSLQLSDGKGNTTNGLITVDVAASSDPGGSMTNPPKVTLLESGQVGLEFHGIPGRSYQIQRSVNMADWIPLGTVIAAPNGVILFTDPSPPKPQGFYRLAIP